MKNRLKIVLFASITALVSFIILFIFYGNILSKTGEVLFSKGGDGLKSYYASEYHLKYDTDYLHTKCMNYPYGEFSFYSDSQPLTTNIIKFFQKYGIFENVNIIDIINSLMLYSLIFASVIIYLLLNRLKLPHAYSVIIANIIVYLSPQLDRMSGHYSLSYVFFIPLFLYFLHIFIYKKSYIISFVLGLITFIALITHGYYFAFFAFFAIFTPIFFSLQTGEKISWIKSYLPHLFIQIFLPFVLFQLFSLGIPTDRTAYPWGFFASRAFPESVFLPIGKPYFGFLHIPYLKWEGMAFIGLVSVFVFLILLYTTIKQKKRFVFIENAFLNAILLVSLISLLFSFAYPFTWHLECLWNYMGPLRQFRASGRFAWLFYYSMNIIAFYYIWNWYVQNKTKLKVVVLSLAILMGLYDAILNTRRKADNLQNTIPAIFDTKNELAEDKWINNLNIAEFQAIMPLPYFHVGSEVYWIDGTSESKEAAFTVSWKTGIPINAVQMSRTSISQTMENLSLYFEPNRPYSIINKYVTDKDILLLVAKNKKLNNNELRFVKYADLIDVNEKYSAYRLSVKNIQLLNSDYRENIYKSSLDSNLYLVNGFLQTTHDNGVIFESFGNKHPTNKRDKIAHFDATKHNTIFEIPLFESMDTVVISFWINNMDKDIFPRSDIKIGNKTKAHDFEQKATYTIFRQIQYVDENGWGLVEFKYHPNEKGEILRLEIWNSLTTNGEFKIDDLLIRKANNDVYYKGDGFVFMNNRYINESSLKTNKTN